MINNNIIELMKGDKKDVLGDFDFSRTDKFYNLKIPSYKIDGGVVFYEVSLKDLTNGEVFTCQYRFKDLKNLNQSIEKLGFQLPPFPKTHFWQKTNNNPQLIQKRRIGLQNYFSHVINDPYLRGYPQVKVIIKWCKKGNIQKRRFSASKITETTDRTRSMSQTKSTGYFVAKQQWKKMNSKNTSL